MFIKKFFKNYWIPITIITLFIIGEIIGMHALSIPSWDASVYVGMGKYIFSHGTMGTWEALRPVGLPLIVGLCWKLGINPYIAGSIFGLLVSVAMLVLVYVFAERVKENTGSIAMLLL
jgi:hypothetical protein